MLRTLVATLTLLPLGWVGQRAAWADEAPPTPEQVAAQVKAAHDAADAAKIAEWAAKDAPDPWLVTDALLASGARAAAEAFAKAAPRKDVERLPELVASWKAAESDTAARLALSTGNALLEARKPAEALAAFEAATGEPTPLIALRLLQGKGLALLRLGRAADAAERFGEVALQAEQLGWLARASAALENLAWAEFEAKRPPEALAAGLRRIGVETLRGNRARRADAHRLVGHLEWRRGGYDAAIAALEQSVLLYDELADAVGSGSTHNDLAEVRLAKRDFRGTERELLAALARVEPLGLWTEVARSHALMGRMHTTQRKPAAWATLAITSYESALEAALKTEQGPRIAGLTYELGRCYGARNERGDQEQALAHHLRAAQLFEGLGERQGTGAALRNAADSNLRLGRDDAAQEQAERVVVLARELEDAKLEGQGHQLLGELAERQKKPEQALAAYTAAAARLEAAGEHLEAARSTVGAAEALRLLGDLGKAREHADRATEAAAKLRDRGLASYAGLVGARIRRDQGLREEALLTARDALALYRALKNSQGIAETEALIRELEVAAPR